MAIPTPFNYEQRGEENQEWQQLVKALPALLRPFPEAFPWHEDNDYLCVMTIGGRQYAEQKAAHEIQIVTQMQGGGERWGRKGCPQISTN